jgi:putative FmdB family regulatory protein
MPFYEYECANCKFYKEVMQKVSDAPLRKCPSCGKNALKKLVSAPVFRLKGAGWYETDFKSDKEAKRNLAEKEPEPEKKKEAAADGKDAKTEAKPAEKATEGKSADAKSAETKPSESKPAAASSAASENTGSRRSTRTIRRSTAKARPRASAKAKKSTSRKRR